MGGKATVVTDLMNSPMSERTFNFASPAKLHNKAYTKHFGIYCSNWSCGSGKSEWVLLY